jgi:TonB-dependent receptor
MDYHTDQDWAGYANLTYKPYIFKKEVELEGGGLYRYKTRTNYYAEYSLSPSSAYYNNPEPFYTIDTIPLAFLNPPNGGIGSIATTQHNNVYTAHETITAGYLQAKLMLSSKLQVLGGARLENTQEDYTLTRASIFLVGQHASYAYMDILPSIHFKYLLSQKENLRLSYFESVSRPGFGDIVPSQYPQDEGAYDLEGNYNLQHTIANNYDLRYELFPGHAEQHFLGAFYKNLQNPIEYYVVSQGTSKLVVQPQNTPTGATNYGFEAVFTKYFGKFGVAFNYTYTNSKVTTSKLIYFISPGTHQDTTAITTQTRPLQGQATNIGNFSLLYKDPKCGLDAQLALAYTGDFIAQVSPYYDQDYWQRAYGQLDFSLEKKISKHVAFFCKVKNLLNSDHKQFLKYSVNQTSQGNGGVAIPYQDAPNSNITVVQRDQYGTNFLAGFKYKF